MKGYRKKLGQWGEELAAKYLESKGCELFTKNYQKRMGEIDLICLLNEDLVFVEVKTRTTDKYGYGEEAVDQKKKKKISMMMDRFIRENDQFVKLHPRFDIIVVEIKDLQPKFIHFENIEF
jgi:putative endonuclease